MSVIAWDGERLAADKRASLGTLIRTTTKVFHLGDALAAYAGDADAGEEILAWFKDGHEAAKFPASQRDKDTWGTLLIVWQGGTIWKYERTPYPLKFPPQPFAIGSGRDFALAAMHCGRTAPEAVEVACVFDSGCGNGVDVLTHGFSQAADSMQAQRDARLVRGDFFIHARSNDRYVMGEVHSTMCGRQITALLTKVS